MNTYICRMYEVYGAESGLAKNRWAHKGSAMLECSQSGGVLKYRTVYIEVPLIQGQAQTYLAYDINWMRTKV